jgi:hypothetical protein
LNRTRTVHVQVHVLTSHSVSHHIVNTRHYYHTFVIQCTHKLWVDLYGPPPGLEPSFIGPPLHALILWKQENGNPQLVISLGIYNIGTSENIQARGGVRVHLKIFKYVGPTTFDHFRIRA